jgi:hypothetical protein
MFLYSNMASQKARTAVVKLESYEGEDTFVRCGDDQQDYLFAIVRVDPDGSAEIMDSSYRTLEEALASWPEARPRNTTPSRKAARQKKLPFGQ